MVVIVAFFYLWEKPGQYVLAKEGPERFVLMETLSHGDGSSTGLYLDTHKQQFIAQKVKWSQEFERLRQREGKGQYEFPATLPSLGDSHGKNLLYGVEVDYTHMSLDSWKGRRKTRKTLSELVKKDPSFSSSQERQEALVRKMLKDSNSKLARSSNVFRLVKSVKLGKVNRAVYYNSEKGEYVYKEVETKRSGLPPYHFPSSLGLHIAADANSEDYLTTKNNVYSAHTPFLMKRALHKILKNFNRNLDRSDLKMGRRDYQNDLLALKRKVSEGYQKIKSAYNDRNKHWYEIWHNPATNEVIFRGFDRNRKLKEEHHYSLNDWRGFALFYKKVKEDTRQAWSEDEVYALLNSQVRCVETLKDYLHNIHVKPFSNILEVLYDQHIHSALADRPIITGGLTFTLDVKAMSGKHPVKIALDLKGQVESVEFINPEKAKADGLSFIEKPNRGIDGKLYFEMVYTDPISEKLVPIMDFSSADIETQRGKKFGQLIVDVYGKQSGEMEFDEAERSLYEIALGGSGGIIGLGNRKRLKDNRNNPFDFAIEREEGSGGIKNFFFRNFYSKGGKLEAIQDAVKEEASKSLLSDGDLAGFIKPEEIDRIAVEVAHKTAQRTNQFESDFIKTKSIASEEAFRAFTPLILGRALEDILPEESPSDISLMVGKITSGFEECLDRATQARNVEANNACLEVFSREGYVETGKEILALKLREAGMEEIVGLAQNRYYRCIQQHYDPLFKHKYECVKGVDDSGGQLYKACLEEKKKKEGKAVDRVKACVYTSVFQILEEAADPMIDRQIGEISREMKIPLSFSVEKKQKAYRKIYSCLKEKGLAEASLHGQVRTHISALESVEPDFFEQDLFSCADYIVADIGGEVVQTILKAKLAEVKELPESSRDSIANKAIAESYDKCMEQQMKTRKNQIDRYRLEKGRRRQWARENQKLNISIPKVDPLECVRHLSSYTTGLVIEKIMGEMIGEGGIQMVRPGGKYDIASCFRELNKELLSTLPRQIISNPKKIEELKALRSKRDQAAAEKSANCLKGGIFRVSEYLGAKIVQDKLTENPEFKDIPFGSYQQNVVGRKIRACLERQIGPLKKVGDILEVQEALTDLCGSNLLKDSEVQTILLDPLFDKTLARANLGLGASKRAILVARIKSKFNKRIVNEKTVKGILDQASLFKGEAVKEVVNFMVEDKINEMFRSAPKEAERVISLVSKKLFGKPESSFEARLIEAFDSKDEHEVNKVVEDLKMAVVDVVVPEVIEKEVSGLVAKGVFENDKDAQKVKDYFLKTLNQCLKVTANKNESFDNKLKRCEIEVKDKGMTYVLHDRLVAKIACDPVFLEGIGVLSTKSEDLNQCDSSSMKPRTKKAIEVIFSRLMTEERKNEMARLNRMPSHSVDEKKEREKSFSLFVESFKADTMYEVFKEIVPGMVENRYRIPENASPSLRAKFEKEHSQIFEASTNSMRECTNDIKAKARQIYQGVRVESLSDLEIDKCINTALLTTTKEVLPRILKDVIGQAFGDTSMTQSLVESAKEELKRCSSGVPTNSKSSDYGLRMNACLNRILEELVMDVVGVLRQNNFLTDRAETDKAVKKCFKGIRLEASRRVNGDSGLSVIPEELANLKSENFYYQLMVKANKDKEKAIGIEWFQTQILDCMIGTIAGPLLKESRDQFFKVENENLSDEVKSTINLLVDSLDEVLSTSSKSGKPIRVDFSVLSNSGPSIRTGEEKPYIGFFKEFEKTIFVQVASAVKYDPKGAKREITEFKEKIKKKIQETDEKLKLEEIIDTLLETETADIAIEGLIAQVVRDEVSDALKERNVAKADWYAEQLASKETINRVFGSGEGKEIIKSLKHGYLRSLMLGQASSRIPDNLINKAKMAIAKDTTPNGFADRILGAIVQQTLDENRDRILGGTFERLVAKWWYRVDAEEDFTWGNPVDERNDPKRGYHLRKTPSARKAVELFSKDVLIPMFSSGLSKEQEEKAVEDIEELVKKAQKENEPSSNERKKEEYFIDEVVY